MVAENHFHFHIAADMPGLSDTMRIMLLTPFRRMGIAIGRVGRAALSRIHVKQELPF